MIPYDFGHWGIKFIFRRSDVFWRAGTMGTMSGAATLFLRLIINYTGIYSNVDEFRGLTTLWGGWTFVISFLLVFRTQIAYSRYTEGIGLLQQTFGVWLNATSNLLAFSSVDDSSTPEEVKAAMKFRHLLVRLMSLLNCTALQDIAIMEDENFNVIDIRDLGRTSLKFLSQSQDKLEVVMQWVQSLICANHKSGVLWIPAPILSRVFQELSNGVVFVHDAMKITEFPFPFPYAQITTIMLIAYSCSLPIVFAVTLNAPIAVSLLAFAIVFSQWGMNYIAAEIEMPFGDDPNDIEIRSICETFNIKLKSLMDPLASKIPDFDYDPSKHDALIVEPMFSYNPDGVNGGAAHRRYASKYDLRSSCRYVNSSDDRKKHLEDALELASPSGALENGALATVEAQSPTVKRAIELQTDYFDEIRIKPNQAPNADSSGKPKVDTRDTPKADPLDIAKAVKFELDRAGVDLLDSPADMLDSLDSIPISKGRLARLARHPAFDNGTPKAQSVNDEISMLPLGYDISKREDTDESSTFYPCDGLLEHI